MLKCLSEVGSHRGCKLSRLGEVLAGTLQSDRDALQPSNEAHNTELETDEQPAVVQISRRFECLVMQYPELVSGPILHYAELEADPEDSCTMQLMEKVLELAKDTDEHSWEPFLERGKLLLMQWNQLSSTDEHSILAQQILFAQRRAVAKDADDVLQALQQLVEADIAREPNG